MARDKTMNYCKGLTAQWRKVKDFQKKKLNSYHFEKSPDFFSNETHELILAVSANKKQLGQRSTRYFNRPRTSSRGRHTGRKWIGEV